MVLPGRDLHAELRILYQEDSIPFHLPVQEPLLSASHASGLAQTLVVAWYPSLLSLTWQLAVTEETRAKKKFGDRDCSQTGLWAEPVLSCFLQDAQVVWPQRYRGCDKLFWCSSHQEGG